jgi:hypothetical protein
LQLIVPFLTFSIFLSTSTVVYHHLEGWKWNDCVFFCIVVVTSVGYGDLHPVTAGGKIFTIVYIILSFTIVFACFGIILAAVGTRAWEARGKVLRSLRDKGVPTLDEGSEVGQARQSGHWHHLKEIFQLCLATLAVIATGAIVVRLNEGWSLLDSFYWSVVTVSTVGFGDMVLAKDSTRDIVSCFLLFAVAIFARSLGKLMTVCIDWYAEYQMNRLIAGGVTEELIQEMEADSEGRIERYEFVAYMLAKLGKATQADIARIMELFNELDVNGSGRLDARAMRGHALNSQRNRKLKPRPATPTIPGMCWTTT